MLVLCWTNLEDLARMSQGGESESAWPQPTMRSRARTASDQVRAFVEGEIRSGRLKNGEKLPTERDLVQRFGVARNTVRRSLQALEDEKLIVRYVGRGTFVAADDGEVERGSFDAAAIASFSPADIVECRLAFEPSLAPFAVARASASDLERMLVCLASADQATTVPDFEFWDGEFHDALAVSTRNPAVIAVCRELALVRRKAEWGLLKERALTPERKSALQRDHYAMVQALRLRDADGLQEQLRRHLLHVQSYMFGPNQ